VLVEVPPGLEYCYSGKMTLIAFATPRLFSGNDTHTKWNPDVLGREAMCDLDAGTWATKLAKATIFGKSPLNAYLRFNQRVWNRLPSGLTRFGAIRSYGNFLHRLVRMQSVRAQAFSTLFLRNRPELELIRRLLERKPQGATLRVAVLGCSTGPEAYSVAWRIRSARPDLKLILHAVDISRQAVEVAECGVYSVAASQLAATRVVDGMAATEIEELFDRDGDLVSVRSWIKDGIHWHVGDVGEAEVIDALGPQDIVVANNFLCHMDVAEAERCLRSIARSVSPQGHLFVSGIDLDIRTKVACDLGWRPLQELLEEIHEGDPWLRRVWPFQYGGLEPLNKRRPDWRIRYSAVFQFPSASTTPIRHEIELCSDVRHQTV
jgi:chemotaxis methyl-accepting protein methylase